jgi:hypothetical protein
LVNLFELYDDAGTCQRQNLYYFNPKHFKATFYASYSNT